MINIYEYIELSKSERQAHIDLSKPCINRGGCSTQFRGILAYFLDTGIPVGTVVCCCHACNNESCSNPLHLYWGTRKENVEDSIQVGTHYSIHGKGYFCENNPMKGIMPWETNNARHEDWSLAKTIYDDYYQCGWNFSKYGKGPSYLQKHYGLSIGASKTMIKLFRNGWNPSDDTKWNERFFY